MDNDRDCNIHTGDWLPGTSDVVNLTELAVVRRQDLNQVFAFQVPYALPSLQNPGEPFLGAFSLRLGHLW